MDISARTDYAVRAMLTLAEAAQHEEAVPSDQLAARQDLPRKFLEAILADLRRSGLVASRRGSAGGYRLGRAADRITLGDIFRAVGGPLAEVRGARPQDTAYTGSATHLPTVWVAVRASLRRVLDEVTVADVLAGELPDHVRDLAAGPDAWDNR